MKVLHVMLGMMLSIIITEAVGLEVIREKTPNWSRLLPELQSYSGINYGPAIGKESFTMTITVSSNNKVLCQVDSSISSHIYEMNTLFLLDRSDYKVKIQEVQDRMKYDHRQVQRINKKEVNYTFYQQSKITKEKKVSHYNKTVNASTLIPLLQAGLFINIEDFYCEFVVEALPMNSAIKVRRFQEIDLDKISPQYELPEPIKGRGVLEKSVDVFETSVQGIGAIFYPHKHYYVYQSEPPYTFIGTWGGPKEWITFMIIEKNLPDIKTAL